jgi:YD repeat-containing protein
MIWRFEMNKRGVEIFFILILILSGAAAQMEEPASSQNTSNIITGPAEEEIEGDPDQPIVTGRIVNPEETPVPETTGIEHEDIGIAEAVPTGIDDDEFGLTTAQASPTPGPETTGIEHEDIGAVEEQERKESGEEGGTEDLTIGMSEMQELPGIDDDEFGIAATDEEPPEGYEYDAQGRLVAVTEPEATQINKRQTIKIADFFVEEKSTGEVVIKGSKIKENSAQLDQDHDEWIEIL